MRCNYCYEFKRNGVDVLNKISSEQLDKLTQVSQVKFYKKNG